MAAATEFPVDADPAVNVSVPDGRARTVVVRTDAGDDAVYLGAADVTAAAGFPVLATDPPLVLRLGEQQALYAICAAAETATVHVLTI